MMAQSEIMIENKKDVSYSILSPDTQTSEAAGILKSYLDKAFLSPFVILNEASSNSFQIHLKVDENLADPNSFLFQSDEKSLDIIAPNKKWLRYGVYTLLEYWGFRKFTATVEYIPRETFFTFPKNSKQLHRPSFAYRYLYFPDAFDESFRDWHKLDWHLDDFGIWGHSFNRLLPEEKYFKQHPEYFALYEGKRRGESLCMTNDSVVAILSARMEKIIAENPEAPFYSISQNDDIIYCECEACRKINSEHGGPQGSLYYFLNKIAKRFPETKITTLAYLHTYNPPLDLKIAPNIHTFFCPIGLNRGNYLRQDQEFTHTLREWKQTTSHLFVWDYTVQFSSYMSPFPNLHTFSENYKLFKEHNVEGLFVQGYADVLGDFSELRQYVLAKLLWDANSNVEAIMDDFLRGFYGKAAQPIRSYLNLLAENQQKANHYLDIYSGPIQNRTSFLTPEAMDQYDQLINEAEAAVSENPIMKSRVAKLRLALEYTYFEQSKFYGKDPHGMFIVNKKGQKKIRPGLTERVLKFVRECNELKIYELSEEGLSPDKYLQEWLEITQNSVRHLGEGLQVNLLTQPAEDFKGKGSYGLVDGNRGHKDFNINWIGWYGNDPEMELKVDHLDFNSLTIHFLEDQRHWIFPPKKVTILGRTNEDWQVIEERNLENLTENYSNNIHATEFFYKSFSKFTQLKILIQNQHELPAWRKRKFRKPMVMIDEIELQKM